MKLLLISDLHANWPALQAVLSAAPSVDGVVCLGDLVNYGPHPAECVRWARTETIPVWIVQGNHDRAIGRDEDPRCSAPYRPLAAVMQRYTAGHLDAKAKTYLAGLPATTTVALGRTRLFLCHATPSNPHYAYLPPDAAPARWEAELTAAGQPDFLLVGHTHLSFVFRVGRTTIVNPGSVGQPKGGDPRAAYAIWQDGRITLKRAAYDIEAVAADLVACAPAEVAAQLVGVLRTGGELPPTQNPSAL